MPTAAITNTMTLIAPAMHDGELRILDTDLAARLGFERPRDIRKIIKRYEAELTRMGRCATVARRPESGGHTVIETYLNEEQALFITTKSETPNAIAVTIEIVTQFAEFKRGEADPSPVKVPGTFREALLLAAEQQEKIEAQEAENAALLTTVQAHQTNIAALKPKAEALDRISISGDEFGLTETAKMLQLKPRKFMNWLDTNRCRYSHGHNKLAYQERIDAGYMRNKAYPFTDPNGESRTGNTIRVTAKGLAWFARVVPGAELDPDCTPDSVKAYIKPKKDAPVPFAKTPEPAS